MTHPAQHQTEVKLDNVTPPVDAPKEDAPPERLYGGQFKTVEELEAAYAAASVPKEPDKDAPQSPATIDEGEIADALTRAGLNMDAFAAEFNTSGALSADSYAQLDAAGFPKELVDVYVDGLRARVQGYESAVYAPVGGKAEYSALMQWAKGNVSDEHRRVFNEAIQSGDAGRAVMAVQALLALRGQSGKLLNGKTSSADPGIQPYASQAEAVAAVRDPRYRNDPAYRKTHDARLALTTVF